MARAGALTAVSVVAEREKVDKLNYIKNNRTFSMMRKFLSCISNLKLIFVIFSLCSELSILYNIFYMQLKKCVISIELQLKNRIYWLQSQILLYVKTMQ